MEQLDFFTVPSPCVGRCESNNRGYCKGCYRSRDERYQWLSLTNDQKRQVIKLCRQRYLRIIRQAKRVKQEKVGVNDCESQPIQKTLFD
ncbi:TPA: DUF1289 domain-containing protein [Photobacterium damselae]|uniref:DUF1289 domain-containing protein n=1 Tax=Photobacterium damselae TaxID=38293 RepID=UPI001EFD5628|nr:DUF1289 domain-containing protein [Photobacterium damselae]MCG9778478.1 DUF1289 domain-containing protein [Photobacterium damselae]